MSTLGLDHEECVYLELLLKAIDSREWRALEHTVLTNPRKFALVAEVVANCSELNGMTILHACIRYDPPPRIIQMIIHLSPSSTVCVDCLNRTALHVAAAIRANPQSIGILLEAFREASTIQDADGKTPLHFACDIHCELFEDDEGVVRAPSSMNVIRCLALAASKSVTVEDSEGISALEYAILSDSDIIIVKFLMHVTQMQMSKDPMRDHELTKENIEFLLPERRRVHVLTGCDEKSFHTA